MSRAYALGSFAGFKRGDVVWLGEDREKWRVVRAGPGEIEVQKDPPPALTPVVGNRHERRKATALNRRAR